MRSIYTIPFIATLMVTGLSFSFSGSRKTAQELITDRESVVVELFTSEGCSSCPPADELAIRLAKEFKGQIYFLSYHVDYWNYLGWKDKFSKPEFSERQRQYATAFKLNSIYTPQAVVNGKREFVGSDQDRLKHAILEELKEKSPVDISLDAKSNGNYISVSYKTKNSGKHFLNVAMVQLQAATSVKKGENNGRYLKHSNLVRDLQTVDGDLTTEGDLEFRIPDGLLSNEMKIIAFMQDKSNLNILSVTEAVIQ